MKYALEYSTHALRDIQKLDFLVRKRLKKSLERFSKDPYNFAEKLTNSKLGSYRFRVGTYRIICDLSDRKITVLRVGHRREIYR